MHVELEPGGRVEDFVAQVGVEVASEGGVRVERGGREAGGRGQDGRREAEQDETAQESAAHDDQQAGSTRHPHLRHETRGEH